MTPAPVVTDAMLRAGQDAHWTLYGGTPSTVMLEAVYLAMQAAKPVDALVDTLVDTPKPVVDSEERERRLKWADARIAEVAARSVDSEVEVLREAFAAYEDGSAGCVSRFDNAMKAIAALLAKLEGTGE